MTQQIVVIHGGRTFEGYEEYLQSLKHREITIEKFQARKDWRDLLQEKLGGDFEVFVPKMPNSNNAVFEEWKIWFERMNIFLNDNVILIGHSLGGIFLAKYLSENTYSKKIKALVLVAAPFNHCAKEPLGNFGLPESLSKITSQVPEIYLLYSKDDPVVPFGESEKYKKALPESKIITFTNKEHFHQEEFPEIVKLIKKMQGTLVVPTNS